MCRIFADAAPRIADRCMCLPHGIQDGVFARANAMLLALFTLGSKPVQHAEA